jgi:hypothetical protein
MALELPVEEARPAPVPSPASVREGLDRIHAALRGLRYGTVTAVVQDGVVVQVERTEKIRLDRQGGKERP